MPVLYSLAFSAPVRSVQMVADVLGINLELKNVDLMSGEHMKPEYLKVNPHHTVPTLVDDDGFALYESRAIMGYLVNKYSPNHSLYPQDAKKRALVDRALYFDASTLYPTLGAVVYPVIRQGAPLNKETAKMLDDKLALLNDDLGRTPYVAGDELTIADLSVLSTWTSIEATGIWQTSQYKNIHAWVARIKASNKLKHWDDLVVKTSKVYGDWIKEKINSN